MTIKNVDKKTILAAALSAVVLSSMGMLSPEAAGQVPSAPPSGIVLENVQSASGTTSPANQVTLPNFSPGSGSNMLLVVGISANNASATSVTFNGVPMAQASASFQNNDAEVWYLTSPSNTGNIVVNMSAPTQAVVGAYSFANVDLNNPVAVTASSHSTTPGSPSISLTTKYVGDWVLDVPSIYGASTLGSPTCSQGWDRNIPDKVTGASSSREVTFPAQVTCNWKASSADSWDDVAVDLKAQGSTILGINAGSPSSIGVNSTLGALTDLTSITVYAHRIPASYWDPCFAATCSAGTGPGATMYVELYDSSMNLVQSGYANENGYTFSGLNPLEKYYVYPDDCDNCHGSPHDVVFTYWGDTHTNDRPRQSTTGEQLHAWYSCTNNCAGGP